MREEPWQVRLTARSIKKKDKLRLLRRSLPINHSRVALDLGCSQGLLSFHLRQRGGFWVSGDEDMPSLREAHSLLGRDLVQLRGDRLPFPDGCFDTVLCLDYLEHVDKDEEVLKEIGRVLKKNGELILVTPQTGKFFLLHKLRAALGLKLEYFGHKREGYSARELEAKLERSGLVPEKKVSYSRFFSEFLELLLNLVYIKLLSKPQPEETREGHIRPSSATEFSRQARIFTLYSFIYPLVWIFSRLDSLLFFLKGYSLMVWARKGERAAPLGVPCQSEPLGSSKSFGGANNLSGITCRAARTLA